MPILVEIVNQEPLLGYGLENIAVSYENYFKNIDFNSVKIPVYYTLRDLTVDRSHNYPLDLLLFSGAVGLTVWLILVILLVYKARKSFLLIPLLVYLVWIQFQNQSIVHLVYFWLLAALINQEGT